VVFFQCFSSVRSVNPRLYIKKDCSWRQGRLEYQSERLSASLCSWKIVEVAEAPLICVDQCSTPRDPSQSAKITGAFVCLMCAFPNRVPDAIA
jgi:hypothetical protein